LREVDAFAKDLHTSLKVRNLTDIVDIIFVSDHGMTDTSHPEWIYIDDYLGDEAMKDIEHDDGTVVNSSGHSVCFKFPNRLALDGYQVFRGVQFDCLLEHPSQSC
jgi:predicted AlkP superfamily pyrophosphatase or phosphodiesterase